MNIRFFWQNHVDAETLAASTSATLWPAKNVKHRWQQRQWRSRYGAGTGHGRFVIVASVNDRVYFDEGGGALTATLTAGTYTGTSLAAQIKARMDAAGTQVYDITYNETTLRFVIECNNPAQTVILKLATTARAAWGTVGFTGTADTTALQSHTADAVRIHTSESLSYTGSAAVEADGCFLFGCNMQVGANITLQLSNDGFATYSSHVMARDGNTWGILFDTPYSFDDARIEIVDIDNPDGYVAIGRWWLGEALTPEIGVNKGTKPEPDHEDGSKITRGELRQSSGVIRPHYREFDGSVDHVDVADRESLHAMFADRGNAYPVVFIPADYQGAFSNPEKRVIYGLIGRWALRYRAGVWPWTFSISEEG